MEAGGMKKNTGQLWKSQYIISDRTAVLQNSEKMGYAQTKLQVEYEAEEYGKSEICCLDAETNTFFNSESAEKFIAENDLSKCENVNIYGDIRQIYCFGYDDKKVVYALTESDGMQNYITIPYISGENGEFCTDISSHRIWKREFSEKTSNLDCALRFRIAPDTWPNIKIKEADMSPDDIFAHAYEAIFNMEINSEKQVEIQLPYQKLCWNSEKKVLTCGKYQMEIKCDKKLSFVTIFDQYLTEIIADNKVLVLLNNLTNKAKEISVIDISGNLGKIRVGEDNDPHIQVETDKDTETEIVVYGLRGLAYSKDATEHCEEKRKRTGLFSQMINSKFSITMLKTAVMVDQMLISSVRRKLCQQTGFLKNFSGENEMGRHDKKVMEN